MLSLLLAACLEPPPPLPERVEVAPEPVVARVVAPEVVFAPPTRELRSPAVTPADEDLERVRSVLTWVVSTFGRDPEDPWAIGHAALALGPDLELANGGRALDHVFAEYGQWRRVGDTSLVSFPRSRGKIRIEPHSDLLLKVVAETGLSPEKTFVVEGREATVAQLYRNSLYEAWVEDDGSTGFDGFHDMPWALMGLAAFAPPGLAWTAQGNHPMTMDRFTDRVVADLHDQTTFLYDAMARGETVEKRKQGVFGYPCGGAHSLQGAAYAVARGFGSERSREEMRAQVDVLYWRLDLELGIYDKLIKENPGYELILFEQRLKFLGHFLESAHELAALGIYTPDEAQRSKLAEAREQLIVTVVALDQGDVFKKLTEMRATPELFQTYLDFVGDSAHALHAIDLSTGRATVRL